MSWLDKKVKLKKCPREKNPPKISDVVAAMCLDLCYNKSTSKVGDTMLVSKLYIMNRLDFFRKLSKENGYMDVESVREFYYSLLFVIIEDIKCGGKCSCPDLGKFEVVKHKATRHRDVNTHELMYKDAIKLLKFKPCQKLKNLVKNQ